MADPKENPFASIRAALAFSPDDWSQHHRHAWIYGIACGWNGEALAEVAAKHGWKPTEVERLRRLHAAYRAAELSFKPPQ